MPSISIDLPKTKHGYEVAAEEVFWVEQGILRSTDLRDSMDEQCIADIAASVIGGDLVERSKDALDQVYESGSDRNRQLISALDAYGAERFSAEFKLCIDEIRAVCADSDASKLRSIIFSKRTTNPFPAAFAVLFITFHELLIGENQKIANYHGVKSAITDLDKRIETSRRSTAPTERRKNVETIKGLIRPHFVKSEPRDIFGDHTTTDIDSIIRRSEIEAPHYELKQGMLRLHGKREIDPNIIDKVMRTICAIANNGKNRAGTILIGLADKEADANRIVSLDRVTPRKVGRRFVVGVNREAKSLGETPERYAARWKEAIRTSGLDDGLKGSVLASLTHSDSYGLGVIVIRIPEQQKVSLFSGKAYVREGDETVEVADPALLLELPQRFI
ncbi:RNA-binding domain-containing protein [Streptomyces sp. NPDC088745]|uniref:RNA-binding domain-containing protein n=1 Tax=Streptomyces sp. NPDC088745 TaxID=3365884 RepID=UPI003807B848